MLSAPAPPSSVSAPSAPMSVLAPVLPMMTLASSLPVPERFFVPVSVRFSTSPRTVVPFAVRSKSTEL